MSFMKSVVFDLDGVLVDASPIYAKFMKSAFNKRGYKFSMDHVLDRMIPHVVEWAGSLLPKGAKDREKLLTEISKEVRKNVAEATGCMKYQKNIGRFLETISKNNMLFLVTNSRYTTTQKILERKNIKRFFKEVIAPAEKFGSKERAFAYLIKKYKLAENDVIYVGDTEKDIKVARGVGCKVIILYTPFSWDYEKYNEIKSAKPDMIVNSFDALVKALEEV